jgi:hypothetical protein
MDLSHCTDTLATATRRWFARLLGKHWVRSAIGAGLMAALVMVSTAAAVERDPHSAAFHARACRSLITGEEHAPHLQGSCAGQIALLLQLSDALPQPLRFCAPAPVTVRQATEAVAAYMERHPAELHHAFSVIAILALRDAFPCSKPGEAMILGSLQFPTASLLQDEEGLPNHRS